jgi:hypothetical protein
MIHLQNVGGRGKDVILKFTMRMGYEGEGMQKECSAVDGRV